MFVYKNEEGTDITVYPFLLTSIVDRYESEFVA